MMLVKKYGFNFNWLTWSLMILPRCLNTRFVAILNFAFKDMRSSHGNVSVDFEIYFEDEFHDS